MLVDFTKGFGGEPDFDWREYAEWLKQAYDHQVGQAWILEQENLRLQNTIRLSGDSCGEMIAARDAEIATLRKRVNQLLSAVTYDADQRDYYEGLLDEHDAEIATLQTLARAYREHDEARTTEIATLRAALEKIRREVDRYEEDAITPGIHEALAAIKQPSK